MQKKKPRKNFILKSFYYTLFFLMSLAEHREIVLVILKSSTSKTTARDGACHLKS